MPALIRWRPMREVTRMQDLMDRLFEEGFFRPYGRPRPYEGVGSVPVDIYETADEYIVKAPMPGVTPEHLDVTFEAGVLTIRGEVVAEKEVEGECVCQERGFGRFARSVSLPSEVVVDEIGANLRDGILTLRIPKAGEIKPKKVSIRIE